MHGPFPVRDMDRPLSSWEYGRDAKEKCYKAPKLIYIVILWYNFVVQSPPPPPCGGGFEPRGG